MDFDDIKEELDELTADLKQKRDELRVQMHLAGAEAKESWENLEKQWTHFEARSAQVADAAKDAGGEIWEATKQLGGEIRDGYDKIRKSM